MKKLIVAAAFFMLAAYCSLPALEGGAKKYYRAKYTGAEERGDISGLQGLFSFEAESAEYAGQADIGAILKRYNARVLFTESAGGSQAYYCRSTLLGEGVKIGGRSVNLMIAVRDGSYSVGTPIVFGSF